MKKLLTLEDIRRIRREREPTQEELNILIACFSRFDPEKHKVVTPERLKEMLGGRALLDELLKEYEGKIAKRLKDGAHE